MARFALAAAQGATERSEGVRVAATERSEGVRAQRATVISSFISHASNFIS